MKGGRIKAPRKKGVARVPVCMQMESMECGAASLCMILAYYGKWVPLSGIRELCGISRDGAKMSSIAKSARIMGLWAQGYRFEPDEFFEKATFPCIVHWNFTHFVVVCGRRGNTVFINDPALGSVRISMRDFDDAFTGLCLCFRPGEKFEPSGNPRSIYSYLKEILYRERRTVIFVVVSSFLLAASTILLPAASRVYLDRILSGRDPDWLLPLLLLLGLICLVQFVVGVVQSVYQMKLFGILGVKGSAGYMWHLFHLPAEFFFQRYPGDLQQNEEATRRISETVILRIVPLLINGLIMFFYFSAMIRYSRMMSVFGLSIVAVNLALSRYIANRRGNIVRVMKRSMGKLMSCSMAGFGMLESIKASGSENAFFGRWAGYQASVNEQNVRYERTSQILGSIPGILMKLAYIVLLVSGVYLVIGGQFTLGCVVAFQAYLTAFMNPAGELVDSEQMIQEMRADLERIEDIMSYPEYDPCMGDDTEKTPEKLHGSIEADHLTFGYAALEEPLIRDISFRIEAGSSVAIVGASGCGKSTILSLVSGLYRPWEGEIRYDGRPMREISKTELRGSMAVIDQNIALFHDTIANNIKMWDNSIEDFEMILAARDALIHDEIQARENGYNHVISEGGANLSGGQRQRIEIARALVTDPSIVIMDEATSALDAATERSVIENIRNRGITCLIVAHRLSTVRDCDRIIVLDGGRIAENGTHEELMELGGFYYSLVVND